MYEYIPNWLRAAFWHVESLQTQIFPFILFCGFDPATQTSQPNGLIEMHARTNTPLQEHNHFSILVEFIPLSWKADTHHASLHVFCALVHSSRTLFAELDVHTGHDNSKNRHFSVNFLFVYRLEIAQVSFTKIQLIRIVKNYSKNFPRLLSVLRKFFRHD